MTVSTTAGQDLDVYPQFAAGPADSGWGSPRSMGA